MRSRPVCLTSGYCASTLSMKRQIVLAKKKRGPPATGKGTQVVVRMQPAPLRRLDDWCAAQKDKPTRAEGLRRLADLGLGRKPEPSFRALTNALKAKGKR